MAVLSSAVSISSMATTNQPVDNWNVDGQHGVVYVKGSLTESPCQLAMTSSDQTVEMGNLDTNTLLRNGKGTPVPFHIELENCLETETQLSNQQTGMTAWSLSQPAVKIRFVAPTELFSTNLIQVTGAHGLSLTVTTPSGKLLSMGQASNPQLLPSGQSQLTYYVTPVKTGPLHPGAYSALIAFEMQYE
ncbi:TPA: fimbrial protein [Providencia alcalifaciens]|nr:MULTISPECIES: fimbrial protein [Providencia]